MTNSERGNIRPRCSTFGDPEACAGLQRAALISYVPSFYDFAVVCQSLSQTQSRLQMAEEAGTFLAALDIDEAEIAARFMVGRAVEQGEEKRLQISGRAIWKIVAEMTDSADQGEDIFTAAEDFGEPGSVTASRLFAPSGVVLLCRRERHWNWIRSCRQGGGRPQADCGRLC